MQATTTPPGDFLYRRLSSDLEEKIRLGQLRAGEKLPSLRVLQQSLGLSLATVYQAYLELEKGGWIEARPRSGFYVRPLRLLNRLPPRPSPRASHPRQVQLAAITADVINASLDPELIPLGASILSPDLLPHKHLGRLIKRTAASNVGEMLTYAPLDGDPELRRIIARRLVGLLPGVRARDLLITNGCTEGVALALSVLARSGDVVAVEAPTHFGFLQLLREMGLKAVGVPADPRTGLDLSALAKVLDQYEVKACLVIPNFHNPLGALMPAEKREELVRLTNLRGVPLIEDDVYGEMHFGPRRPGLLKRFDRRDMVITCSSVSKVLAPGFRIGWCIPGERFGGPIRRLKSAMSMAAPTLQQRVVAEFLAGGAFDRYLRMLRGRLQRQVAETVLAVQHHFPAATRLAMPRGGNMLWLELPAGVSGVEVYRRGLDEGVSSVPGGAFAVDGGFGNYVRLSCTSPFDARVESGVATLGRITGELEQEARIATPSGRSSDDRGNRERAT